MINTARPAGAIGSRPIIPSYLIENKYTYFLKSILDFGCGKTGRHVKLLNDEGFAVWGEDLSLPYNEEDSDQNPPWLHKPGKKYDLVFANSVINVQSGIIDICTLLDTIKARVNPGGMIMLTVPQEPWKPKYVDPAFVRAFLLSNGFKPIKRMPAHKSWIWTFTTPKLTF